MLTSCQMTRSSFWYNWWVWSSCLHQDFSEQLTKKKNPINIVPAYLNCSCYPSCAVEEHANQNKWLDLNKLLPLPRVNITTAGCFPTYRNSTLTGGPQQEKKAKIISPWARAGSLSTCWGNCQHCTKRRAAQSLVYSCPQVASLLANHILLCLSHYSSKTGTKYPIPILLSWTAFNMPLKCTAAKEIRLLAFGEECHQLPQENFNYTSLEYGFLLRT